MHIAVAIGEFFSLSTFELSPYPRRSDHLPRLSEASAGPEDVVLVLVGSPVLIGSGTAASAVLCEGGGGIDLPCERKKALLDFYLEDTVGASRDHSMMNHPVHVHSEGEQTILPFIG